MWCSSVVQPSRALTAGLVIMIAALVPAAARADGVVITQHVFTNAGLPQLIANYSPDGGLATPSWKICAPDCGPVVATGNAFTPGDQPAGTSFEASTTLAGTTTTAHSRTWLGRVANTAPPTFTGSPVVGSMLTPAAGTWSGGWGNDYSWLGMRACRAADGQDCHAMNAAAFGQPPSKPLTVDSAYVGWYVGAVETRLAAETAIAGVGYSDPTPGHVYPLTSPALAQTVAVSALVGPVTTPSGDDTAGSDSTTVTPEFTSRLVLRKRALLTSGTLRLGTIRCSSRCVAHVTVKAGGTSIKRRLVVKDAKVITVKRNQLPLAATTARIKVSFDGHKGSKSGRLRLRS
jgi:hypothetical protein